MEYTGEKQKLTFEQQQELNHKRNSAMGTACEGLTTQELQRLNPNLLKASPDLYEALKALPEPKSILSEAAYTGGDVPKKWIAERSQFIDGYNQALKEITKLREKAIAKVDNPSTLTVECGLLFDSQD